MRLENESLSDIIQILFDKSILPYTLTKKVDIFNNKFLEMSVQGSILFSFSESRDEIFITCSKYSLLTYWYKLERLEKLTDKTITFYLTGG